jgi:nitrogenase molybdenum-iron protein alpha/beta subunit
MVFGMREDISMRIRFLGMYLDRKNAEHAENRHNNTYCCKHRQVLQATPFPGCVSEFHKEQEEAEKEKEPDIVIGKANKADEPQETEKPVIKAGVLSLCHFLLLLYVVKPDWTDPAGT